MIKQLMYKNFRGAIEKKLEFGGNVNIIKGPNEAGKSTICEAIAFTFTGCDSSGTKNPDHLIRNGSDSCEVVVATAKAVFVRKKKRGETSKVKIQRPGLPDLNLSQTELSNLLKMDTDLFLSSIKTGYFMELPSLRKLEVISQAVKIDRLSLLNQLVAGTGVAYTATTLPKRVQLKNVLNDAAAVATERRVLQNQLAADEGAIKELELKLGDVEQIDIPSYEKALSELNALNLVHSNYSAECARYNADVKRFNESVAESKRRAEERKRVLDELALVKDVSKEDVEYVEKSEELISLLRKSQLELVKEQKQMPTPPKKVADIFNLDTCPTCDSPIAADKKEAAIAFYNAELVRFNEESRAVADHNNELTLREKRVVDDIDSIRNKVASIKMAIQSVEGSKKLLAVKLESLKELTIPEKPIAPVVPEGDAKKIAEELSSLNAAVYAAKSRLQLEKTVSERKVVLNESISTKKQAIAVLAGLENALKQLPALEVETTRKSLEIKDADISLIEGDLVVSDRSGVPYASLSTGRKKKVDLELCKCFQRMVKNPPGFIFADDADLVDSFTQYLPDNTQVFMAKVDSDLTEVEVIQM